MGRVVSLIFDNFKGSIGAAEIGGIVCEKLSPSLPTIDLGNFPASDGGDGFVDALAHHTGGSSSSVTSPIRSAGEGSPHVSPD